MANHSAPVSEIHTKIADDALQAATDGWNAGNGQLWGIPFNKGPSELATYRAALYTEWNANGWSTAAFDQWHLYLDICHSDAGDLWDSQYDLGVRIAQAESNLQSQGVDTDPSVATPVVQAIQDKASEASSAFDAWWKKVAPDLANLASAIKVGLVIVLVVLVLYAVGPFVQGSASIYKTAKES
jgi:hypothetical protein